MANRYVWSRNALSYTLSNFRVDDDSSTFKRTLQGRLLSAPSNVTAYVYQTSFTSISYAKASDTTTNITIASGTYIGAFNGADSYDVERHHLTDIGTIGTSASDNTIIFASNTQLDFPVTIEVDSVSVDEDVFAAMSETNRRGFGPSGQFDISNIDGTLKIEEAFAGNEGYSRITAAAIAELSEQEGNTDVWDYRFKSAIFTRTTSKGTSAGTVSNASSGAYPADGTSGNYWYELQGNDNIDASAVGYNTQQPRGGQPITITVTPSAGNVYGGTVRYTYQVQLAGGAWQTISSNNTATSLQYTIPAGTATFAARVLASDTWGFSSTTYTTGATLTVINNDPPSAPDGINIGAVLGGEQCTITWGAATDADGTIASYQLERQIDNGDTWTQIYTGLALTYDDTINSEWATVNYRVRAVDDDGAAGPYTTGTMQTVNAGWLYFSGPDADMGDKPAPFTFAFSIGSTTEGTTDISVSVLLDDENIYTGTPDAGEQVSLEIDTRLSYEGEHTIVVTFEKANLLGDQYIGTYNVPALEIPDGGHAVQLYNSDGEPVFPNTFARQVFAQKGDSAAKMFDRYFSGTYTGTGTSGAVNPCSLRLSFVPRFLFVYSPSGNAWGFWIRTAEPAVAAQGTMATNAGSCTVQWDNENMILSWYGSSASVQLNVSGTAYGYVVTG